MKNETIAAIAALVVIVLGIQAYMTFRLNDRINQLSEPYSQAGESQTKTHNLPQSNMDNDFFKGRTWNPYAEIQHMQNEMEQMFDDSFSRFHMNTPLGSLSKMPDVDLEEKPDTITVC